MKRKFFLRRAAVFFTTMLIPTLVLFALFLGISVNNANIHLVDKGVQTIRAVQDSCEIMLNRTAQQNDLLTGTTRMNVSLKRALHQTEMTYGDSVFLTALGSMVRSTVDSNLPLARIMIWLDGAGRIFSSDGSSIQPLEQLADQEWRLAYGQMSDSERELLTLTTRADGRAMLTSIRRLLLQKGCTVVDIDVEIWKEKLLTLLQRSDEHLFLIREDGQLLLHVTNTSVPCAWAQDAALLQTLQHSEAGRWLATDYGHFLVSKAQMDQLCLLSVVP